MTIHTLKHSERAARSATLYAITNEDNSVSVLDATFQRIASWPDGYVSKPKRSHNQMQSKACRSSTVMLNCWKYNIVWVA